MKLHGDVQRANVTPLLQCGTTSTINFDSKHDILYVRMVTFVVTILPPFLNIFVHLNHSKLHNMIVIMVDLLFLRTPMSN
jgi:hypothetical protein